ncbi:ATP-binding protein [Pedobacter hartonius]|nr:ATP-binding protein [Pedobacter hartonius]
MNTKRFISLILSFFVVGTLLLAVIQFNSSSNIEKLISGNAKLMKELRTNNHLRELERDMLWVESRIRAAIATDDLSHLEGVDERIAEMDTYLDSLKASTVYVQAQPYISRLSELAKQKANTKDALIREYKTSGHMDNLQLIANPGARQISNEISDVVRKIYDGRQRKMLDLSRAVEESGRNARLWGSVMISLIVLSGCGWFWFIVIRLQQQNQLIMQLDSSEKKAREAALVKENFMANMSHEIRTPLNSILGFTNLLQRCRLDAEPEEFVLAIQKAGENLLAIINDILDLSKIEAGMMRIENNPFSVRGLFHSVRTLFSERIKEKRLEMRIEIEACVPDTLIGDATRLTQILVNLIGNAIKFTEKGHIFLHIYTKKIEGERIELGVVISDTGIGISKDKISGIFDRFHQAEDTTTRNYGGTGLGLSIVKDLLLLQNGGIYVDSEPGKGTTFRLFIPYQISSTQITANGGAESRKLEYYAPGVLRLLVVDDNKMNQSLMKHLLTEWNLSFDIAGDGLCALVLLKENTYDIVLMDIQMPGMDGYATARRIRKELHLNIPIIAMTAHALAGEREKCLSYGMDEYLSKPVNEQQLYHFISKFSGNDHQSEPVKVVVAAPEENYRYINLSYMRQISKGNVNYERQVTGQFIELVPKAILGIDTALIHNDFLTVSHIAHDLKTSVYIMGMTGQLDDILDQLEYNGEAEVIQINAGLLKKRCVLAVQEARHYYELLNQKNYQL